MFSKMQSTTVIAAVMIGSLPTETGAEIVPPPQFEY